MPWSQWYTLRSYTRSSLWIVPFISLLLYVGIIRLAYSIGNWITWEPLVGGWSASGTRSILETIVTLTLTFIVFTFGSLLVAIQVAGGQLTPRIIAATLLRDNAIRFTVGLFIFTLLFAAGALGETGHDWPAWARGGCRPPWLWLYRRLSLSDRLRSAAAATGKHRLASWRCRAEVIDQVYPETAARTRTSPSNSARETSTPGPNHSLIRANRRSFWQST